jgi:hypothetical protein
MSYIPCVGFIAKQKTLSNLWWIPVRCAAEAVCNVVRLPRLPLNVEVVDGEVLSPLLASWVADFVDLFMPDAHEWPMIGPDRELLHVEEVVPALLDRVLDCERFQLDYGVGLLGWVETASSASH